MNHSDISSSDTVEEIIGSATSVGDIIAALAKRGCRDLTTSINQAACSQFPRNGGGYCDVYQGKLDNGTSIAIKSLRIYDGPNAERQRQKILKHTARELYHWSKLRHPNALPLLGLAIFRGQISMVSEWMGNGNLSSFLELNPDADRDHFCINICEGLCYIHSKGMAHGDLKAANVMVSPTGVAMIADFGCARLKDLTLKFTKTGENGLSIRWAAPELLDESDGSQGSQAADVYAYGMTVLEVLSGEVPFAGHSETRVIRMVAIEGKQPPRPDIDIDDDIWEILVSCWAPNPDQRISITRVSDRLREPIKRREMSVAEILEHLCGHGCKDVTDQLDLPQFIPYPGLMPDCRVMCQGALPNGYPATLECIKLRIVSTRRTRQQLKRAAHDLYSWSKCNHPNIVGLIGVAQFQGRFAMVRPKVINDGVTVIGVAQFQGRFAMVHPIMINDNARSSRHERSQVYLYDLCAQVADAVAYIHSEGLVHGEIKGDNLLFAQDYTIKLTNFRITPLSAYMLDVFDDPVDRWAAPEMIEGSRANSTTQTDIYSLGMTILEIITGSVPYYDLYDPHILLSRIVNNIHPRRPEAYLPSQSEQANLLWSLLTRCWAHHPQARPTAVQVRNRLRNIPQQGLGF